MHDLVIRGGRVIDTAQGWDGPLDVAIDGHRIAAVGTDLSADGVRQVLDATGLIVTPGLVDLHTHAYWGVPPLGIEPDPHLLRRGVTTAVDAGSAGASTFPAFRRYVIDAAATRILALLNLSQIGMARDRGRPDQAVGELEDLRWARVDRAIEVARAHAEVIVGIKVRASADIVGRDPAGCLEVLRRAREVADAIGRPIMVHIGSTPVPLAALLARLRAGDLITHTFHGGAEGVLDAHGRVRPAVWQAIERGVGFDVGHGAGSFSFDVARRALAQGLVPATISSDLHAYNVDGPVYDLVTTASKFLHLGLSLADVLARITAAPARAVGVLERVGTLAPGAEADVTLLRVVEGEVRFRDSLGQVETGNRRIEAVAVVRAGRVWSCTPAAPASASARSARSARSAKSARAARAASVPATFSTTTPVRRGRVPVPYVLHAPPRRVGVAGRHRAPDGRASDPEGANRAPGSGAGRHPAGPAAGSRRRVLAHVRRGGRGRGRRAHTGAGPTSKRVR